MREYRLLYLTDFWSLVFCNGRTDTLEAAPDLHGTLAAAESLTVAGTAIGTL